MEKISSWPKHKSSEEKKQKLRKQREQDHKNRDLWKFMTNVAFMDVFTGETPTDKVVDKNKYISNTDQLIQESDNIQREAAELVQKIEEEDLHKNLIIDPRKGMGFVERNQIERRTNSDSRQQFQKVEAELASYSNRLRATLKRRDDSVNRFAYVMDLHKIKDFSNSIGALVQDLDVYIHAIDKDLLAVLTRRSSQYDSLLKLKNQALTTYEPEINDSNIETISKNLMKDLVKYKENFFGKQNEKLQKFKERSQRRISFYLKGVLEYAGNDRSVIRANPNLKYVFSSLPLFKELGFNVGYQGRSLYNVDFNSKEELYKPFLNKEEKDEVDLAQYLTTAYKDPYKEVAKAEKLRQIEARAVIRSIKPPLKSGHLDRYRAIIQNYVKVDQKFANKDANSYYGYRYTGFESITKDQFQNVKKGTVFSLPTKYLANKESAQIIRKMLMQMNIGSEYVVVQHKKTKTFWVLPAGDTRIAKSNLKG